MASPAYSTSHAAVMIATRAACAAHAPNDAATLMLARLFPRWKGDTSEPALPPPPRPNRPAPAAAVAAVVSRQLVGA